MAGGAARARAVHAANLIDLFRVKRGCRRFVIQFYCGASFYYLQGNRFGGGGPEFRESVRPDQLGCGQGGSGGSQHPESQRAVARGSRAGGARSGVIFKKAKGKAYIITNTHVISGSEDLEVVTSDGVSHKAKVTGQDSINDIAVLEIGDRGIHSVIDVGDSNKLRAGETVIAVGNPLGLRGTLTSGIVSNTSRMIPVSLNQDGVYDWEQEVIQTDAAINEGNSGGALVDLDGRLIGINTMKIADTGVEGLGFAIPVNDVMKTVDDLLLHGKVVRPYIGVYTLDLDNPYSPITDEQRQDLKLPSHVTEGVIVLEAHGPALTAGLKLNDVIIQLDKQPINSTMELRRYLYENKKIGEDLQVSYYRDGKLQSVMMKLTDKPSDEEIDAGLEDK